eukprot:6183632-Pleurochrysis_carterae.AAC.2
MTSPTPNLTMITGCALSYLPKDSRLCRSDGAGRGAGGAAAAATVGVSSYSEVGGNGRQEAE